jgi:hypothetical protein
MSGAHHRALAMKRICYRIGTGACQTGWVDTVTCTDPNIYDAAIGGAVVVGALEVACGDCPATVTLAGGGAGGTYTDPTPDLTNAELRAAPIAITGGLTSAELRAAPVPVTTAVTVRTAALQSGVVTAGTVTAGAYEVGFSNDGTTNATVAGGALAPGRSVSFVTHGNDTLAAITYTANATSALSIVTIR